MRSTEQIIDVTGGITGKPENFITPNSRAGKTPNVISMQVGGLEHKLTFGLSAKIKMALATVLHKDGTLGVYKKSLIYGTLSLVLVTSAIWAGSTLTGSSSYVSPTAFVNEQAQVPDQTEKKFVEAFEEALDRLAPGVVAESTLSGRAALINKYLLEWNSPLAEYSRTIAEQDNWKYILAISFAESGLGKYCADNNCSGIGVEPGHPNWQVYETKGEWVKALNKLLEKRYNGWSLEKMNGTYNVPGSSNWVAATNQIIDDLRERQIE